MLMLKSILVGAASAYAVYLLYVLKVMISAHRKNAAVGAGAWYAYTVHSPLFWVVLCGAFGLGTFFTLKLNFPPLYR